MKYTLGIGLPCLLALAALGCGSSGGTPSTADSGPVTDEELFRGTSQLEVPVPESGRVYVALATPSVLPSNGGSAQSKDWDLAFEGFDVFTNGGVSGPGQGAAFGQLELESFLQDQAPEVPFLSADKTGGAFLDWYAYDGNSHALYSRFHVYGVRRGDRLWKLQILSYYGERDNAPVSALYSIRYAELGASASDTQLLEVDGTAGGLGGDETSPSGCLDLETGVISRLSPEAARASSGWDVCFRRDSVSVNGEAGGPRAVSSADLQAGQSASEELSALKRLTADSEQVRFGGIDVDSFAEARFRGDHIVSAFETGQWLDASGIAPARAAWLVAQGAAEQRFLVAFSAFNKPTTSSPGTVVLHVKPVIQ